MSTAARAYVHGLVEENLGLPKGVIGSEDLPADLVDHITSAVRGKTSREAGSPLVEQELNEFLLEVKRYSLEGRLLRLEGALAGGSSVRGLPDPPRRQHRAQ